MSKQTKIDSFLRSKAPAQPNKKIRKEKDRSHHESSKQNSQLTIKLDDQQQDVKLDVFGPVSYTCPVLIVITPGCVTYYKTIEKSLRQFCDHYNKEKVLDFMLNNLKHHRINNLLNLQKIEDQDFWFIALPEMIEMVHRHMGDITGKINMLTRGSQEVIDLTRRQIFLILASMFLGIFPKQVHEDCVHFGELMTIRENQLRQNKITTRREKLACFITYFNTVTQNKKLLNGAIRFQRTKASNNDFMDPHRIDREVSLKAIQLHSIKNKTIEDYCGKGIMIDFANRKLGGGVLRNGCVQQQILFSIFPEAVVSKIICQQLQDNEAVIIYGARRFSKYSGYSDSFEFKGVADMASESQAEKSIIVAIDATDFSSMPNANYQYSRKGMRREISKANVGFQGAGLQAEDDMPIVTGRWGCGAFKGDEELKFLIQWVAASEAEREMVYITENQESIKTFQMLYKELKGGCTAHVLGILEQYSKIRPSLKNPPTLIQYIKNYA